MMSGDKAMTTRPGRDNSRALTAFMARKADDQVVWRMMREAFSEGIDK